MLLRSMILPLALLAGLTLPAHAQDAAAAERFLRDLYSHYRAGAGPFLPAFDPAPDIFTPAVVALIRKDQEESLGEVGRLDVDPLCICQDFDDIRIAALTIASIQSGRTVATVELVDGARRFVLKITLRAVNRAWRIDDIQEGGDPSLRRVLNAPSS